MKEFIEHIAKQLVDKPENVIVEQTNPDEKTIALTIKADKNDIGKVIGKQGKHAQAMRVLLNAVGAKGGHRTTLQILD
ncbi:MAG: KH domain-containing protein [Melioribacteraceae bacterium]|nr:KH domain-containing protein [Melioribacteraceae bacterium]